VRDAFEDAGCDAWSCDILPTESHQTKAAGKHYRGDVMYLFLNDKLATDTKNKLGMPEKWDMMIGFPPCTYMSNVYQGQKRYADERLKNTVKALQFFIDLWTCGIEHICLENPVGTPIHILPYKQIIQPYFWGKETGEDYSKKTCLF
jgi:site-specific DNA-cytosine methylase